MRYLTFLLCLPLSAAISNIRVIGSTQSQIAIGYTAPDMAACSVDAVSAETLVSRAFTATGNGTTVTLTISATKLDIPTGQGIYISNSGVSQWDGWQITAGVTDNGTQTTVTFSSATSGTAGSSATAYLPVVDINTAIFTASNLDSRSGALTLGRSRTFVLGTRGAQRGTATGQSTRYFSRALQPATKHLVRITCGSDTATTAAWTTTIPVGATGGTALPADRNNPGVMAEPTFDWQDTSKWYTDPTTGLLTKMLSVPGVRYAKVTGQSFATAIDQTGTATCTNSAWANVCGPTQAGTGSATVTATTTPAFFRTQNLSTDDSFYGMSGQIRSWQFFTVTLTGSSTGSGNNATVQVALTGNGVTPYTTWKDVDLTTCASGCQIGAFTAASDAGKPVADNWLVETPTGWPVLNDKEVYPRSGTVTVASGGTSVTWASSYKFNELWAAGTHITINSQDCVIASVQSETALTVNSCGLSAGTYSYSASNAGLLVRNKVSSASTNTISALSYELVTDGASGEPSDGGFSAFNTTVYSGYYPLMIISFGNTQSLYSLNATTAESHYLGSFRIPARTGGFNTWTGQQTPSGSSAKWDVAGTNPTYYWTATQGSNVYLVKIEYTSSLSGSLGGNYTDTIGRGSCTNSEYVMTCSDTKYTVLTPKYNESGGAAVNHDLFSLILAFDPSANTHLLTTANCGINQVYNGGLILYTCPAGNANDKAFLAYVIDLGDGDPTHAGTTGAHVIARIGSDSPSLRACTLHSPLDMGPESGYAELSLQRLGGGTTDGIGPWYVTTQSAIEASPSETCPDSTPNACTTVTVDAFTDPNGVCPAGIGSLSPYDPTPFTSETGCPGEYITPAVGDLVFFTKAATGIVTLATEASNGDEGATLVAVSGNQFTFKRGTYNSAKAYAAGGTFLSWHCKAQLLTSTTPGNKVFWDLANDPTGDNVVFDSQNRSSHQALWFYSSSPYGAYSEGMSNSTSFCLNAFTACWHNTTGPPSGADKIFDKVRNKTNMNPGFAGTTSAAGTSVTVWQTHPGVSFTRGIDFRSRGGGPGTAAIGFAQNWAKVSSTSYLWKTSGTLDSATDTISGDVVLHRKVFDTWASCGVHPLVDASPAVLTDSSADWYKYVVVRNAGEGRSGSVAGEVYVNCPNISTTANTANCYGAIADTAIGGQVPQTICVSDSTWWSNAVVDYSLTTHDPFGANTRVLAAMTSPPAATSAFANAHFSPDQKWLMWNHPFLNYFKTTTLVGKIPPMAPTSTATRNSFRLKNIVLHPPSGVDNVIAKVGYAEYGSPSSFYCTSRAEACVIGASRTDSNPWQYASESITGISVSGGVATIPLRLIPGRIAYWQYLYRDASGNTLSTSPIQVAVAP